MLISLIARLKTPGISIICGGDYHPDTGLFKSAESIALIKKTRAARGFCSAAAVHETMGLTGMNSYEAGTRREIMSLGAKKILRIGSSKFGALKSCYAADFTTGISVERRERILSMGAGLEIV